MGSSDLFRGTGVQVGPIFLAEPVLTTWGIMVVLIAGSWIVTQAAKPRSGACPSGVGRAARCCG